MTVTMRDEQSSQRFARKLLHRLSESLALALLCETAGEAHQQGNSLPSHSAWRFYEELELPAIGGEDQSTRQGVPEVLAEDVAVGSRVK